MDRLSTLDAEFLHLEDGIAHMHIAGACVFANPPPSYDDVFALVAGKLHQIPRYRQRVRTVPFELGRPVWADDPHFDLGYHLRHTSLPAPGGDEQFTRLVGRLMSQPLDRDRPLWETWLVEGLDDGRWAMVFKIHHCMVDGIAGVELLEVLLDVDPRATPPDPLPWSPEPEPNGAAKVVDAWVGLAGDSLASARRLAGALGHPGRALGTATNTAQGVGRYLRNLTLVPQLSTEGSISPHRVWAHARADLADVKAIRAAFGGTVNDVVLAAVSGGFRSLLESRGDDLAIATVRSLVPVSTRGTDGHGVPDNRVSAILYELPVQLADPVERLAAVRAEMSERKGSHMAEAGEAVTTIGDLAPPMLVGTVSRATVRLMHRVPQWALGTITTNVPGPQLPLYCLGREMLDYGPFVPIFHGLRVATAILSYNGHLFFGITGDQAAAPDVGVLAAGITAEIDELRRRAATAGTKAGARPAGPRRAQTSGRRVARSASRPE